MHCKTARVIVTDHTPDGCEGNYPVMPEDIETVDFAGLLQYDGIILAGGEPMLMADRMVELVHRLHANGFAGSVCVETAYINPAKRKKWADKRIFEEADEIAFVIRPEYGQGNITALWRLSRFLDERSGMTDAPHHAFCRLLVARTATRDVNWKECAMSGWDDVNLAADEDQMLNWAFPGSSVKAVFYDLANA